MPARHVLYFGGGATAGIVVVALIVAAISVPVYPAVMKVVALLISTMVWAAIFRKCAPILFALESKFNNAFMNFAVFVLYKAALAILCLSLCKIIESCDSKLT